MNASRRQFLRTGATVVAGSLVARERLESPGPPVRTITYNVLGCRGYPRTDANRNRLERAGEHMGDRLALELELHEPDIVTFQESPPAPRVAAIAERMGYRHASFEDDFPGSLLSRHEVVSVQNRPRAKQPRPGGLFTRHWGRAVLRVHGEEIVLFSAHLHPSKARIREREVSEMLEVMKDDLDSGRSLIFQGDLNHTPDGPEYGRWREAGWVDTFARAGKGDGRTFRSTERRRRIDYIFAHGPIAGRLRECRVLFEGGFRTNPEDPRSFALSDHLPVMASFAGR